jgi:hypothetical protein
LMILDIEDHLQRFRQVDIDALSFNDQNHWVRWIGELDRKARIASDLVVIGRRLLTPENLDPFTQVIKEQDDVRMFRRYLQGLRIEPNEHRQ